MSDNNTLLNNNNNNNNNNNRFSLSSPSINNIIEAAGYGGAELDSNDLDQHTGWTPLIKQSMSGNNNNNNNNSNRQSSIDGNINEIYTRTNSIGNQYQQIVLNQFSSPSKIENNNINLERLLAIENEFIDNNSNFPFLLSTTPVGSKSSNYLLHDLFMDTPNLSSNSENGSNSNTVQESPTKLMQHSLLMSAQKRLTPYKLHQLSLPMLYPETPGTKFVKSFLELPVTTTPLPPPSLPRVNRGSPLKDSFTATPLTRKSKNSKRKALDFETPKKKLKKMVKTPQEERTGSSPSTIKITSISPATKLKNKANQQLSPTPASQHSSQQSQQQQQIATHNLQPPPIGTFKKEEKHAPPPPPLVPKNTTKGPKFQIIFQDVNSLMKKSLLKNKRARSKSGILTANNNKKNRLSRSITYAGIDNNNNNKPLNSVNGVSDKENQFAEINQPKSFSQPSNDEAIRDSVMNHIKNGLHDDDLE